MAECGGCLGRGRLYATSELTGEPGTRTCGACKGTGKLGPAVTSSEFRFENAITEYGQIWYVVGLTRSTQEEASRDLASIRGSMPPKDWLTNIVKSKYANREEKAAAQYLLDNMHWPT